MNIRQLSDKKNIKMGVLLSYLGMIISLLGTLFISNRVLNYIGDYKYGLYSFINSITSWITVVSSALTASFLRFSTIESNNCNDDVSRTNTLYLKILAIIGVFVLFVGLTTIVILFFCNVNIGKYDWNDSKLMYALFALSIFNIALTMPASIFSLYINFRKKFVYGKMLSIVITILNFMGHLFIAYFTKSIVLIAAYTIIVTIVTLLSNLFFCKKYLDIKFAKASIKDNKTLIISIAAFSVILLVNSIVDQINHSVDKTLLGIFSVPENVTIYQMGQQFDTYLMMMSVAVSGVFAPTIHQLVVNQKRNEINQLYITISKTQTIILCMVTFGFMACGYDFILWWIGPTRINAYYVGVVLMLIDLCPLTMNSSIEIQRAENKHKFRAIVYIGVALVNILLSIVFLNILPTEQSIFACLAGSVIARICSHWIAMNIYNKTIIKLPVLKYLLTLLKYVIVGMICFAFVFEVKQLWISNFESALIRMLLEGGLFVVSYGLITIIVDYKMILKIIKK